MAVLQDQLESLVAEVASYTASNRGVIHQRRGIFKEPEVPGYTVPKDPHRLPLNVRNGDYAAQILPANTEVPVHLNRFKESHFVDTSTHTRFSLYPPDGLAKPDLLRTAIHSPTKDKPIENRGPGDIPWDSCMYGQGLGTYINCTPASKSVSPGKDRTRLSQPFAACERPDPLDEGRTAGSGLMYQPALPDFKIWHQRGFSTTAQLRTIRAETWGASTREPRDPNAAPPQMQVPAFDNRGFPFDVSRQAELHSSSDCNQVAHKLRPGTCCHPSPEVHQRAPTRRVKTADAGGVRAQKLSVSQQGSWETSDQKGAKPYHRTYGRQGVLKLDRQTRRDGYKGMRTGCVQPYADPGDMGPGVHEPLVHYHGLRRPKAEEELAVPKSSWGAQKLQPLLRAEAVWEVRKARHQYLQEQKLSQMKALSSASQPCIFNQETAIHNWPTAPPDLHRQACVARKNIINV